MRENFNDEYIEAICREFGIEGEYRHFELITHGHINTTFKVFFFRGGEIKDYILQRVNAYVFKNPVQVMDNISTVTEYIRAKIKETGVSAKRYVLHFQKTVSDGKYYYVGPNGGFWRCSRFIDDSDTFGETDDLKVIEETGKAFGDFQLRLADFPAKNLYITIPHFHNTVDRYRLFDEAVKIDEAKRAESVADEIAEYKAFEEVATKMYRMQRNNELPLKVTHNDTKCNNVLFDKKTKEYLCVIDRQVRGVHERVHGKTSRYYDACGKRYARARGDYYDLGVRTQVFDRLFKRRQVFPYRLRRPEFRQVSLSVGSCKGYDKKVRRYGRDS